MCLFGSAINIYGGPGEASHKSFVKAPGLKTQRRMCEFAKQTVGQYYNIMMVRQQIVSDRDKFAGMIRMTASRMLRATTAASTTQCKGNIQWNYHLTIVTRSNLSLLTRQADRGLRPVRRRVGSDGFGGNIIPSCLHTVSGSGGVKV